MCLRSILPSYTVVYFKWNVIKHNLKMEMNISIAQIDNTHEWSQNTGSTTRFFSLGLCYWVLFSNRRGIRLGWESRVIRTNVEKIPKVWGQVVVMTTAGKVKPPLLKRNVSIRTNFPNNWKGKGFSEIIFLNLIKTRAFWLSHSNFSLFFILLSIRIFSAVISPKLWNRNASFLPSSNAKPTPEPFETRLSSGQ